MSLEGMKYHLVTLGCQMNKSDSERISAVIEEMGYVWTDKEEKADLLGVIACSVRQKAIDKVYNKITGSDPSFHNPGHHNACQVR